MEVKGIIDHVGLDEIAHSAKATLFKIDVIQINFNQTTTDCDSITGYIAIRFLCLFICPMPLWKGLHFSFGFLVLRF